MEEGGDPKPPPFLNMLRSPDTSIPNSASAENCLPFGQHCIDKKVGPTGSLLEPRQTPQGLSIPQVGKAVPKEAFQEGRVTSPTNTSSRSITLTTISLQTARKAQKC